MSIDVRERQEQCLCVHMGDVCVCVCTHRRYVCVCIHRRCRVLGFGSNPVGEGESLEVGGQTWWKDSDL